PVVLLRLGDGVREGGRPEGGGRCHASGLPQEFPARSRRMSHGASISSERRGCNRRGRRMTESHDNELVQRLRDGDESAFAELIDGYRATMLRVAQMYVRDRATAEEVVQETWLAVLNG